jgi:hypothetical protein
MSVLPESSIGAERGVESNATGVLACCLIDFLSDVYARRWCSSVSGSRPRHKGVACGARPARTAPVSPHAHRVRPSPQHHSIGVVFSFSCGQRTLLTILPVAFPLEPGSLGVRIVVNTQRCRDTSTGRHDSGQIHVVGPFSWFPLSPDLHLLFGLHTDSYPERGAE